MCARHDQPLAIALSAVLKNLTQVGLGTKPESESCIRKLRGISHLSDICTWQKRPRSHCWETNQIDPCRRVNFWNSVLREALYELHFEVPDEKFEAVLRQQKVGPLRLSYVSVSSGHTVTRTRTDIARTNLSIFHLNCVQRGTFQVTQHGEKVALATGECVLLDSREPYRVESTECTAHVCVQLPVAWLQHWIPRPVDYLVRPVRQGVPWSAALSALLNDARFIADTPHDLHSLCADQIAGVLALALGSTVASGLTGTRRICERLIQTITDMSHDPELDARSLAAAMSISPRYVYKILARENTTYAQEVLRIRLERSARMLRDSRFHSLSIAEIAWRSGFRDPSHFSKRFREKYHSTPGEFRSASTNSMAHM